MVRSFLAYSRILLLGLAICACEPQKPKTVAVAIPPPAQDDTSLHGGGVTTNLPARTGSQASGVEGSSTTIGAPPKGQTGLATAH
jgi:hypothetical protein